MSVTECHREKAAGIFARMQVGKVSSFANFRRNRQRSSSTSTTLYRVRRAVRTWSSRKRRRMGANVAIANTESRIWPIDEHNYIWRWPIQRAKVKFVHVSTENISQTVRDIGQMLQLSTSANLEFTHTDNRLAYLHVTSGSSKGQSHRHVYLDCEYFRKMATRRAKRRTGRIDLYPNNDLNHI